MGMREGCELVGGRECVGWGVGRPMPSLQLRPSLLDVESEGPAQTTTTGAGGGAGARGMCTSISTLVPAAVQRIHINR